VTAQLNTLGHTSNLYATEPGWRWLRRSSTQPLGADAQARVFFCNSGTEANEVAFKTQPAHRTHPNSLPAQGCFPRPDDGFRWAPPASPPNRRRFEPLPGYVTHVPLRWTSDELAAAVTDDQPPPVFLEPIMGEGGVVVPPAGYLAAAREITSRHGALLVLDEGADRGRAHRRVLRPPSTTGSLPTS